jgi:hypothetical protein
MSAIAAHRDVPAKLPPAERLSWWVGFISAGMGAALASVGEAAMRVLKGALVERGDTASLGMRKRRTYLGPDAAAPVKKKAS